ncbi:hypothetical protein HDU67_006304 [Dinochytrium kinnereticum]|nr:hypothetical protein HDU67_006304 [Dinochytrium kinnereticum]
MSKDDVAINSAAAVAEEVVAADAISTKDEAVASASPIPDASAATSPAKAVMPKLGLLDKLLPLWILIAMGLGLVLGYFVPSVRSALDSNKIADVSIPIAVGLLWMMYPVLCKVKYERLPTLLKSKSTVNILSMSLLLNVIVAPLIMTALAWMTLPDLPNHRTGIILVGVARCIAMVLIWNQLAGGDAEWCAILVAVNAILQLLLFGPTAYFLCVIVGKGDPSYRIDLWLITRSVLIFLGIPLLAGVVTRVVLRFVMGWRWKGAAKWYDETFLKFIGPTSLLGLLFTIVVMFALQGERIVKDFTSVLRVSVPLLLYFTIVFSGTFLLCLYFTRTPHALAVTQSFTAAGNNFELAIAVAVASYGIDSKEALATVIGPLIEVPVLLGLVHLAVAVKGRYDAHMIKKFGSANPDGAPVEGVLCADVYKTDAASLAEMGSDVDGFLKAKVDEKEIEKKVEVGQQASTVTLN